MMDIDLLLLHPPSVYDFREKAILYGPISDLIPSSTVFEMYPLGFLTTTAYLEARGLRVRIVNLALRMMNDATFDVPAFLARLQPRAVGIDLHWLPHAHGAIEIARIVKHLHPQVPVIMGGLSATYFHEELVRYPSVDYILRGNSTEIPMLDLLETLRSGGTVAEIPNLTWMEGDAVRINEGRFTPTGLDYVNIEPARIVEMVLRFRDLQSVLPFNGWWQNPITAVFTVKGCTHECVTCGSARAACKLLNAPHGAIYRSPQNLVRNMQDISAISRGPIFLVGDLRQAGDAYATAVLHHLQQARIKNEIVFELFSIPPAAFLQQIDHAVANWSLELSPESHDEEIRRRQDSTVFFSNQEMEETIQTALSLNCHRIDVFFMIGLPGQTQASVMESIAYCEKLFRHSDQRLSCFISPLGPFLDPASKGFEAPEAEGYHLFARTLAAHRELLVQPTWERILNYETRWMSRRELVEATYDAGERLNGLKLRYGRLSPQRGRAVAAHIAQARALKARVDALLNSPSAQGDPLSELRGEITNYSISTVCDKRELFWRRHLINFKLHGIIRVIVGYALQDIKRRLWKG
jgi:B12-binding domain/radical SAM domain protein